jgi:hypothetical protein
LADANPVPAFLADRCILDSTATCWMKDLYLAYCTWSGQMGFMANLLKSRLADLRAAASVEDLPLAKLHHSVNTCVFDLTDGYQLEITPNHTNNPMHKSGKPNWAKIQRVKITKIGLKNE